MKRILPVLLLLLAAGVTPAGAQSLYSAAGLGLPVDAVDARSRALGNMGIGLMGNAILPTDPAAAATLGIPGAVFTAQPSWVELARTDVADAGSSRATRFPLVGVAYPFSGVGMVTVTFASVLDQRYQGTRTTTVELDEGPVSVTDEFTSDGGVSRVGVGLARTFLGDRLEAGVTVGRFTGSTFRALVRSLEGVSVEGTVSDFSEGGIWAYSGTSVTAGAGVRIGTVGRVAASLHWSSGLTAEPSDTTTAGGTRSFDLPVELRVGGSALLAPGLLLTASLERTAWSQVEDDLRAATARDALGYGVGVELTRARLFGRQAPIRLGWRSADLPFPLAGGEASESAFTGGLGLALAATGPLTLAGVDITVERGERTEVGITEEFWRAALTLRVAGF